MSGNGRVPMDAEKLAAMLARRRAEREEFDAAQLAALDALWRAQRAGQVAGEEARRIEDMIRNGRVPGARKRLSNARRDNNAASD